MTRHSFFCIDAHTCGNPVRVVVGGAPDLPAQDAVARRRAFQRDHDWIRRALMFEPRGHDAMSGSVLYPSTRADCALGLVFIETTGCLPMCGHGTIGTVTVAVEHGLVQAATDGSLSLDTPAGVVVATVTMDGARVRAVRLRNVPSFLAEADVTVPCPELCGPGGSLSVDIAYGGNFYAIIEPQPGYGGLEDLGADRIIALSPAIRDRVQAACPVQHPEQPAIDRITHVMWTDAPRHPRAHARNAVFYGARGLDRSPCGTGTSARMAQLVARGALAIGQEFVHESLIGSLFDGRVEAIAPIGQTTGIIPSIAGWAQVTGLNTILVDSSDPFAHGFSLSGSTDPVTG